MSFLSCFKPKKDPYYREPIHRPIERKNQNSQIQQRTNEKSVEVLRTPHRVEPQKTIIDPDVEKMRSTVKRITLGLIGNEDLKASDLLKDVESMLLLSSKKGNEDPWPEMRSDLQKLEAMLGTITYRQEQAKQIRLNLDIIASKLEGGEVNVIDLLNEVTSMLYTADEMGDEAPWPGLRSQLSRLKTIFENIIQKHTEGIIS